MSVLASLYRGDICPLMLWWPLKGVVARLVVFGVLLLVYHIMMCLYVMYVIKIYIFGAVCVPVAL